MGTFIGKIKTNMELWQILLLEKCLGWIKFKENKYVEFVKEIAKIDSIENYEEFYQSIKPILGSKAMVASTNYGAEATLYGYYDSLFEYAKMEKTKQILIPSIEHGVRFGSPKWKYKYNSICYACQGTKRIHEIYDIDPMKPIFVIGPYIHYASYYYSEEKMKEMKSQLGRTLLVFPSHTCENETLSNNDKSFINIVYNKYASDYDTIMVCAYWNDVDDPIMKLFEEKGAKIVSAGFRGDSNFIRRLKSLLYIADDVVVNDIGTNIGFAKYMNCNIYLEGELLMKEDKYYVKNYEVFKKAFFTENKTFSKEQEKLQDALYREFWGGEEKLLTSEEMQAMLEGIQQMCKKSGYRIKKMPEAMKQIIKKCEQSNSVQNMNKARILASAIKNDN